MFFQGSLQEGISTALQESKLVVCFVTDGESESQTWEDEFLTEESLKSALESQAIALRLQAGSQEAGFLEALFPVPRKPTLVMIQKGQLREYIAAGTSKEEFLRRAQAALGPPPSQTQQQPQATEAAAASTSAGRASQESQAADDNGASSAQARQVQAVLAERAKRLEADKKAKEAAAKAAAEARAKARKEIGKSNNNNNTAEASSSSQKNINPAERKYADELRHRKQQAAEERRRILKRIEDDRLERKEREAQGRQARLLAQAQAQTEPPNSSGSRTTFTTPIDESIPLASLGSSSATRDNNGKKQGRHQHCNLQIRLFSGSTIRARFPAAATLAGDVRPWIDRARRENPDVDDNVNSDAPYTFRVVLTPLPNRAIAAAEEESDTLESLGLAPSATLVLVPVPRFAEAYALAGRGGGGGGGNPVARAFAGLVGLLAGIWGVLVGFLVGGGGGGGSSSGRRGRGSQQRGGGSGHGHGHGHGEDIEMDDLSSGAAGRGGSGSRIKGFENEEDRKKRRDAQLYNGNSLNFEPRRDDDDDDDGEDGR